VAREVKEGQTEGGLPYLSFGEGPPLVVLPGLGMTCAANGAGHIVLKIVTPAS